MIHLIRLGIGLGIAATIIGIGVGFCWLDDKYPKTVGWTLVALLLLCISYFIGCTVTL